MLRGIDERELIVTFEYQGNRAIHVSGRPWTLGDTLVLDSISFVIRRGWSRGGFFHSDGQKEDE